MKTVTRNFGTIVMVVFMIVGLSASTLANEVKNDSTGVEFKYIGKYKNQPVFELDVPNAEKDEYTINIIDQYGAVLYFNRVKGKSVNRKFMLNIDELEGNSFLRVEIKAKKSDKPEVFEIVNNTRLVSESSVSKL